MLELSDQTRLLELSQETGASSWLTALPLLDEEYDLNKQCFQDLLLIRYCWSLKRFPVTCECGSIFNIDHALTCKKVVLSPRAGDTYVRVFNPLTERYGSMELMKCYTLNEKEKKKAHNNRIIEVEHGTLTPLVFSVTGGMSRDCRKFYSRLSQMLSDKRVSNFQRSLYGFVEILVV